MPGFVTHYIFGRDTYHKLDCNPFKSNLRQNRAAFGLGLQGPDLFFYYLPSYLLLRCNPGALAHDGSSNIFFESLLMTCLSFSSDADRRIAEAYLAGFLGHYTLDTVCHPYIYAMTDFHGHEKDYFSRHAYLETDIDSALLFEKLHRTPAGFSNNGTIALTHHQKKVIATMLHAAYQKAFPHLKVGRLTMRLGIFSIRLGMRILQDKTGQKKVLFRFLEHLFLGYPLFSPLIPSSSLFFRTDPFNLRRARWKNPWNPALESEESFLDLYRKSMELYLARLNALAELLGCQNDPDRQKRLIHAFLEEYGNRSFLSGIHVPASPLKKNGR